jgi:signal transduction histidine kinase
MLLDLQMPIMDGFEVLSYCKGSACLSEIPVIVLTADRLEKLNSLKLGADDFLAKPYDVEELELRVTKLIQSRRLLQSAKRSKNEFLTIARNELRTPMLTITNLTELLDGNGLTVEQQKIVDQLKQATGSLTGIFKDILNFVQLDHQAASSIVEPFSLRSAVKDALESQRESAGKNETRLKFQIADTVSDDLNGPSFYVYKVCDILVENAVKFSPAGSEVSIAIKEESLGKHSSRFCCTVRDQGIGIPAEFHNSIFEPFVQVGASPGGKQGGIGLGLAIAKRMVELMGGTICVKSKKNKGSSFIFSFKCDARHPKNKGH